VSNDQLSKPMRRWRLKACGEQETRTLVGAE
jgi:hypothetical protein